MIPYIIIAGYIVLPDLFNLITTICIRKKTLNKMLENLEEKGYKIDSRFKESLPQEIYEGYLKEAYSKSNYYQILTLGTWVPFLRWECLYYNIKYLTGNYVGYNRELAVFEDSCLDEDVIEFLEKEELIEKDLEKQIWLTDRNAAIKKLEEKYDDVEGKVNLYSFSEKNSTDELYAKMEQLQEIIERRQSDKQNNNDSKVNSLEIVGRQRI